MVRKMYGGLLVSMLVLVLAPPALGGEVAIGVTSTAPQQIVRFDTATPGTITSRAFISGLATGEHIDGIDARPATGEVFALLNTSRMLIIDAATGETFPAGPALVAPFNGVLGSGFDFNPTVDRLRLVSTTENLRWNPASFALAATDTDVAFAGTDPNAGDTPNVVGAAYTNNDTNAATPTTVFAIESGNDVLVRMGGVDGAPSPNGGVLTTIGPLGVAVDDGSLDIATGPTAAGNVAWAALQQTADTASRLYNVNLATGAATLVGTIAAGDKLSGLTILPGGSLGVTSSPSVAESAKKAVVRVARTGDTLGPAQVVYRTANGTAIAGADYTAATGVLSFAQGERTKDVTITIAADAVAEPAEWFRLELGAPIGGAVVDTPSSVVQIADNQKPVFLAAPTAPDTLRALRKSGRLTVDYSCSEACAVTLTLKMGRTVLGKARATRSSLGVSRVSVRISAAGKKALAKAAAAKGGKVKLTLAGTAADSAGNATKRSVTLSVRRR